MIFGGSRVRLKPFTDGNISEPEEFGTVISAELINGTIIVLIDEQYRESIDDGIREVSLEEVEQV